MTPAELTITILGCLASLAAVTTALALAHHNRKDRP